MAHDISFRTTLNLDLNEASDGYREVERVVRPSLDGADQATVNLVTAYVRQIMISWNVAEQEAARPGYSRPVFPSYTR